MNLGGCSGECSFAEAVALAGLGIVAVPQCFVVESTGASNESFALSGEAFDAASPILSASRKDALPAGHPFLTGFWAVKNLEVFRARGARGCGSGPAFGVGSGGPLLCFRDEDAAWLSTPPAMALTNVALAAAIATCGFPPVGFEIHPERGPAWLFARCARYSEGETLSEFYAAAQAARGLALPGGGCTYDFSAVRIGSAAPGEHPFCYAAQAMENAGAIEAARREAASDPAIVMRGRGGRSAVVSLSLTEQGADNAIKRELPKHLK